LLELSIDPHPVAKLAVGFQHRLEPMAIDRALYCHLTARRQLPARFSGKRKMVDLSIVYSVASKRIVGTPIPSKW
jgi:hypothetical protein